MADTGLEVAAKFVEARRDAYITEHGHEDPDTGSLEFPGDGAEYVQELTEVAEGIRALAMPAPADCPHAAPFRYCPQCLVTPCPVGLGIRAAKEST